MTEQKLPDDLLIEILSSLPTKSLIRFQCVSKSWNSLIAYVSSQRKILLTVSGFVIRNGLYVSISPDPQNYGVELERRLRKLPFYSTCHVIHSCNGLFLFTLINEHTTLTPYYVWNPATIESVALPEVPTRLRSGNVCFLAYDPHQSPHYKVVRFTSHLTDDYIIVEVFSSITGRWVMFIVPSKYAVNVVGWSKMSVFHRGALYLLSAHDSGNLIRFDVEMSGFQLIDLPDKQLEPECYQHINVDCIGESRGHLHYMVKPFTQDELNIYVLKELDTNKWVLTHKINTNNEIFSGYFCPIAFHPESEVIYLSTRKKIISYHPCSGLLEEFLVGNCNCVLNWKTVFLVNPCMESIDPPGEKLIKLFALENSM